MGIPGSVNPLLLASQAGDYEVSRSLRFNSSDSAYLSRTPASAGNRKTWTWAGWVKRGALGSGAGNAEQYLFRGGADGTNNQGAIIIGSDTFYFVNNYSTGALYVRTTAVFRDPSAWYHFVVSVDTTQATASNRAKLYVNGVEQTALQTATYPSQNYDTFINDTQPHTIGRRDSSFPRYFNGYLADIHFIDGQALTPSSFAETNATTGQWVPKAYTGTYGTNGFHLDFSDNSTAAALGTDTSGNGNNWTPTNFSVVATPIYSNFATATPGWYYNSVELANATNLFDSSTSTRTLAGGLNNTAGTFEWYYSAGISFTSQLRLYFVTAGSGQSFSVDTGAGYVSIGVPSTGWNTIITGSGTLKGIKSTTPGDAGGTNWTSINAIELDSSILVQTSPAGNDSLVDTPTSYGTDTGAGGEVRGNYATWNPLVVTGTDTFGGANGNLDSTGGSRFCSSTIGVSSGKWYAEITIGNSDVTTGIWQPPFVSSSAPANQKNYRYYGVDGKVYSEAGATATSYNSYTSGDVIGIALDLDNGKLFFAKNGTWQGSSVPASGTNPAVTGLSGTWVFGVNHTTSATHSANFGQRPFAYTAPSGFKALCDANLPAPVVAQPSTVMDVLLWSGTGGNRSFSSLNMSPDFVWIKQRNQAFSTGHQLYDIVRGAGSDKELNSAGTAAEGAGNIDQYGWLSSFDSNGFSVTAGPLGADYVNASGTTYVAWAWDAGTTTASNTDGSITSSVRANASAGFSIVSGEGNTYFGGTLGHGLGVAPEFILAKDRDSTAQWYVYHKSLTDPNNYHLILNSTSAQVNFGSNLWNVTSTTMASNQGITGRRGVYYCFAPVAGYSSFGSYTGNGSADGPFVYTGFRPRWVMVKLSSASGGSWNMRDTSRSSYNAATAGLFANLSNAESTQANIDVLSNGFKIKEAGGTETNTNGATYIYAAFAESPFQYARAR